VTSFARGLADKLLRGPSGLPAKLLGPMDIRLRRITPGDGPPYNPGPPTTTDYEMDGVVGSASIQHADGTLVSVGDKRAVVAVPDVEPTTADRLIVEGIEHPISKVERITGAGEAAAFVIYAKA
jgi:hypothetical protein